MRRRSSFVAAGATVAVAAALAPAAAQADGAHCGVKPLKPTLAGAYPADCRVYEKVSPAEKGNGEVQGGESLVPGVRTSRDGNTYIFGSDGTFAGAVSFAQLNAYAARRGGDTWTTTSFTEQLPHAVVPLPFAGSSPLMEFQAVGSPPLAQSDDGVHLVTGTNVDQQTGEIVPGRYYRQNVATGQVDRITPFRTDGDTDPVQPNNSTEPRGTADYSTLALSLRAPLTADTAADGLSAGQDRLYLWRDGQLRFIGRTPGTGAPSRSMLAHGGNNFAVNDVSADGRTVFWTPSHFPTSSLRLFRYSVDSDSSVDVAESENPANPDPGVQSAPTMVGATPDGQDVFFTSQKQLVPGMPAPGPGTVNYLYRYRHSASPATDDNLTLLTPPLAGESGYPAVVTAASRASRDGSTVYMHVRGPHRLTADAPPTASNEFGIYRWHAGSLSFVTKATVNANGTSRAVNEVSDDGRFYVFDSATQVTSIPTGGTTQRYVYDAATDQISCASCNPSGPTTTDVIERTFYNFMSLGASASAPRRYVGSDGTVIVESPDRLLPADKNGSQDVYAYRGGTLRLASTGEAPTDEVRFSDMSVDGGSIFFVTREQLSAWDTDNKKDAYVARVNGGLPEPAIRPEVGCAGDACQPRTVVPPPPPVTSLTFVGPGNVDPGPEPVGDAKARKPKTIRGTKGSVRVKVPAEGRVRVSGNGLRRATRKASKARTLTVPVRLSKRATRTLNRKRRFKTRITVRYTPEQGETQRMRVSVRFTKAKKKSSSRSKQRATKAEGR